MPGDDMAPDGYRPRYLSERDHHPDFELPEGVLSLECIRCELEQGGAFVNANDCVLKRDPDLAPGISEFRAKRVARAEYSRNSINSKRWQKLISLLEGRDIAVLSGRLRKDLKRRLRQGVPNDLRLHAWFIVSGGEKAMAAQPGRYAGVLVQGMPLCSMPLADQLGTIPHDNVVAERYGVHVVQGQMGFLLRGGVS